MAERFTDKMAKVTDNLEYFKSVGAPEEHVMQYLSEVGVTPAQLRQYHAIESAPKPEAPGLMASMGRGIQDVAAGVGQLTGTLPQMQNALTYLPGGASAGSMAGQTDQQAADAELQDVTQYEQAQGPGMDWGRVAGQAIGSSPLAAIPGASAGAGLLTRVGAGALAGGASGGVLYAKNGQERLLNAGGGAIGGGLFGAAAPALTKATGKAAQFVGDVGRKAKGLLGNSALQITVTKGIKEAADEAGIPMSELGEAYTKRVALKAKTALTQGEPFDYAAAVRAARAEKFGFTGEAGLMRGQANRSPRDISDAMNLSKRPEGGAIAERLNNQLANAEKYMDDLAQAPDLDPVDASDGLRMLAKARADAMQADVGAEYAKVPKGGYFPLDSLESRTSSILQDYEDKVSSGVKSRIKEIMGAKRERSMAELIKLDKLIGDTMPPGQDAAVNRAADQLRKAVLGVMDDAAEEVGTPEAKAAYVAAKNAARARFEKIGPSGGLVSQLVHGKVDPTQIPGKIMGGSIDDLRRLKKFIFSEAEKGPIDRWETIKRMVENQIQTDARPGGQFSQAAYDAALKRIKPARLKEIFGEAKTKELYDFRDVARDVFQYPKFNSINTSNSGAEVGSIAGDALGALVDNVSPGARLLTGLLGNSAKKKAEQAAAEQMQVNIKGLLGNYTPRGPRPNPLARAVPYAGASAGAGSLGLLEMFRAREGRR
jgi:hypothetical protein